MIKYFHLGYLYTFTEQLLIALEQLPGDERTMLAFIGVDSAVHFFQFRDKSHPQQLIVEEYSGKQSFWKAISAQICLRSRLHLFL